VNPYKILQVDREAEQEVIDAAYRRLAAKYHPDKDGSPSATERMKEINAAHELLRDTERRRAYDQARKARTTKVVQAEHPVPTSATPRTNQSPTGSPPVFWIVVGLCALVALVVYFPWGVAILLGVWGTVRLVRRFPGVSAKIAIRGLTLAATIGAASAAYIWMDDRQQAMKRESAKAADEDQARRLDVKATLKAQVGDFLSNCIVVASKNAPPRTANEYCSCVAAQLEAAFDVTPFDVHSVNEFYTIFAARFAAASPGQAEQGVCAKKVAALLPTTQIDSAFGLVTAAPTVYAPAARLKPIASAVDEIDPAVRDAVVDRYKPRKP
jgi:curved DNA-binding protein CbpA